MAVNCLAHIFSLSAKALLLGLRLVNANPMEDDVVLDNDEYGQEELELNIMGNDMAETVVKVNCS